MPSYIEIDDLVQNTKRILHPLCVAKNIEIKTTINDREKIYGDPNMVQTILRNILTNAIKFSYSDSCILLDFSAEGFYSVIKVTDNGIGMSHEELSNLFKIDKIPARVGTNKESSNGLGLIVCHEFVQKHGGTIEVEAEEDLGTTVIVKLPFMRYNIK
jgi:signal transduction histidine kinase